MSAATAPTVDTTIGQLVADRPARSRLFEKLGIDYCCGGKRTLADACQAKGLDAKTVAQLLVAADDTVPTAGAVDAAAMSLTQLADHIEQTHHQYLKRELPRLSPLVEKIAAKHGPAHPNLAQLSHVFAAFREELESHMMKEERILFPMIRQIDAHPTSAGGFHCGSIDNPIRVMELEHQHAGDAMEQMRALTEGYSAPADACNTYRAVMQSLAEIETDMHQHVHKENNVLFPRASRAASGGY